MTTRAERGFTIIEVMLFLAITGALSAALMIGVGTGVTQQRYLDSVRSFKALVQNQYAAVINTENQNVTTQQCNSSTGAIESGARGDWGASDCVILGRAIVVRQADGGDKVEVSSVTAPDAANDDAVQSSNDIDVFKDHFRPQLATFDLETVSMDWGSKLMQPATGTGSMTSVGTEVVLILRSPNTGLIRTFVTNNWATSDLVDVITSSGSTANPLEFCVTNGSTGLLPQQMLTIDPTIASADAVKLDGGLGARCRS